MFIFWFTLYRLSKESYALFSCHLWVGTEKMATRETGEKSFIIFSNKNIYSFRWLEKSWMVIAIPSEQP